MSLRKEPCLRLDARALVVAVGFRWSAQPLTAVAIGTRRARLIEFCPWERTLV